MERQRVSNSPFFILKKKKKKKTEKKQLIYLLILFLNFKGSNFKYAYPYKIQIFLHMLTVSSVGRCSFAGKQQKMSP